MSGGHTHAMYTNRGGSAGKPLCGPPQALVRACSRRLLDDAHLQKRLHPGRPFPHGKAGGGVGLDVGGNPDRVYAQGAGQ